MSEPDFHFTFHFSNFQYPLSQDTASTILHQPVKKRNRYGVRYKKKHLILLPVKLMRYGAGCMVAFLASASLFLSSSDGQALTKYNYKMF